MQLPANLKQQIIHHLIILAGFVVLALAYCSPVLEGKKLYQSDIVQWKGWSKEIQDFRDQEGEEALWTNRMFSGMTAFNISTLYKTDVTRFINHNILGAVPAPANMIVILLIGMFVLLRGMGVNTWLSAIGAVAFAFSSNYLISLDAGHNGKVATMGLSTGMLGGILLAYRGKLWGGIALTTLFTGLMFMHNHVQIVYYALIMTLFIAIGFGVEAVKNGQLPSFIKTSGLLLVAALVGIAPNTAKLWSVYTHGQETMRGGSSELKFKENKGGLEFDYAMSWSTKPEESLTTLVPYYMGGGTRESLGDDAAMAGVLNSLRLQPAQKRQILDNVPMYYGEMPFTEGPVYFGAGVIMLFFLGMLLLRMPLKWAFLIAIILSFLMAWGRHFAGFNELLFNYLPMYNKFRTPSMALHIAGVLMPLLGLLGVHQLMQSADKAQALKRLTYAGVTTLVILGIIAIAGYIGDFSIAKDADNFARMFGLNPSDPQQFGILNNLTEALAEDRKRLYLTDTIRSTVFVLLVGGVLWLYLKGTLKQKNLVYGALALLLLVDVWSVSKRYMNNDDFVSAREYEQAFQPSQADLTIMQDPDPYYRVFNTTRSPFNDAITSYHHNSIGGYHPAKLQRYQDMIDYHISLQHMPVLNMLNTKYFITQGQGGQPRPQQNPGALGNAWFVSDHKLVSNADREIAFLDKVYEVKDLTGSNSLYVHRMATSIDTVGSFETVYISTNPDYEKEGFPLDLSRLNMQPGQILTIGSADTADIVAAGKGLAAMQATVRLIYAFNPAKEAIIDRRYKSYLDGLGNYQPAAGDQLSLSSYAPNELVFQSNAAGERLAVFSDMYYNKGWEVTIDNQPAEYIRVNYLLRGLRIPAGEHTITWTFRPASYYTGKTISLAGSALFLLVIFGSLYLGYREAYPGDKVKHA